MNSNKKSVIVRDRNGHLYAIPASFCFKTAMIWLSVNFDVFMQNLLCFSLRENSTFEISYFLGGLQRLNQRGWALYDHSDGYVHDYTTNETFCYRLNDKQETTTYCDNLAATLTEPTPPPLEAEINLRELILYREDRLLNSGAIYTVDWQGQRLGELRNGSALRVRVPSGNQTLTISNGIGEFEQPVTIADAGETYLLLSMKFSFSDDPRTQMILEPVSPSAGSAAVATLGH